MTRKGKERETARQKKIRAAEEEFRRQVSRERAYFGMHQKELAEAAGMPPSTLCELMKEPGMLRVWQLRQIVQILGLEAQTVMAVLGLEVPAQGSAEAGKGPKSRLNS